MTNDSQKSDEELLIKPKRSIWQNALIIAIILSILSFIILLSQNRTRYFIGITIVFWIYYAIGLFFVWMWSNKQRRILLFVLLSVGCLIVMIAPFIYLGYLGIYQVNVSTNISTQPTNTFYTTTIPTKDIDQLENSIKSTTTISPTLPDETNNDSALNSCRANIKRKIEDQYTNLTVFGRQNYLGDIFVRVGEENQEETIEIRIVSQCTPRTLADVSPINGIRDYIRLFELYDILYKLDFSQYCPRLYTPDEVYILWKAHPTTSPFGNIHDYLMTGNFNWEDLKQTGNAINGNFRSIYGDDRTIVDEFNTEKTYWSSNEYYDPSKFKVINFCSTSEEENKLVEAEVISALIYSTIFADDGDDVLINYVPLDILINNNVLTINIKPTVNESDLHHVLYQLLALSAYLSTDSIPYGDMNLSRIEVIAKTPLSERAVYYVVGHDVILELATNPNMRELLDKQLKKGEYIK